MPVEPNPFDDAKLAEIRAEQGDPIIQYYIVRTDVPMSIGKAGAQIAHAAQMFVFGYLKMKSKCDVKPQGGKPLVLTQITEEWMNGSFRKVVLVTWPMRKSQQPKLLARLRVLSSLMELPQIQGQDNER